MRVLDVEKCLETKNTLRKYNLQWKKYSWKKWVGDNSKLYNKIQPLDYQDFFEKYTMDPEGRTEQQIIEVAKLYQNESDPNIPLETYIDNIYCHVIVETFDGHIQEKIIKKYIEKKGFHVCELQGDDDSKRGIDLAVYKDDKLLHLLQIKPFSFFCGDTNHSLIEDRANAFDKRRLAYKKYGVETLFVVYKKDRGTNVIRWMSHDDGKILFHLDTIAHESGLPVRLGYNFILLPD